MFVSFSAIAVAAVVAGSIHVSASTTLSVQLIQRCPPSAACVTPRVVVRMRKETEQIWSSLDVRIEWADSRRDADAARIRQLTVFLEGDGGPAPVSDAAVLASLHPPAEPCEDGIVRIWMRNVRQQIGTLHVDGVPFVNVPAVLADVILARALGRALAHEIGHYLLGTGAHAERGLMRARFAPPEFVEELSPRYRLTARERESIASCRATPTETGSDALARERIVPANSSVSAK